MLRGIHAWKRTYTPLYGVIISLSLSLSLQSSSNKNESSSADLFLSRKQSTFRVVLIVSTVVSISVYLESIPPSEMQLVPTHEATNESARNSPVKSAGDIFLLGLVDACMTDETQPYTMPSLSMSPQELELVHARRAALDNLVENPGVTYNKCEFSKFMHEKPAAIHVHSGMRLAVLENFHGTALDGTPLVVPATEPGQYPWERVELWATGAPAPWQSTETMSEYEWRLETILSNFDIFTPGYGQLIDPRSDMRKATEMIPSKRRRRE